MKAIYTYACIVCAQATFVCVVQFQSPIYPLVANMTFHGTKLSLSVATVTLKV